MITDNILGKEKKYKASRLPIIRAFNEDPIKLDPELRRLRHVMIRPSENNREYCFWLSSIAQSFTYITAATIIGDGLRIRCANKTAKSIVEEFNDEINVNGKSIEDYITSTWIDEINHSNSYWRVLETKDLASGIDIQRLDPKTITKRKEDHHGWTALFQRVGNYKRYNSEASFYRNVKLSDRNLKPYYPRQFKVIVIPDKPNVVLRTSFFVKPPIASTIRYISYKHFILYFMRKYSQRLWTPFILFLIGDTKSNYYPEGPQEMQDAIDDMSEIIPDMASFGGAALPGNVIAQELGKGSAKNSEVFVTYIEALDKQIMLSIFGSMGLREASGVELSTNKGLRENLNHFLRGIRRKYALKLTRFYTKCLLPANGIMLSPRDLNIEYYPLDEEPAETQMKAIEIGSNIGMFKDRNEVRKAGQVVWNWLDALDDTENKKIEFMFNSTETIDRYKQYNQGLQ